MEPNFEKLTHNLETDPVTIKKAEEYGMPVKEYIEKATSGYFIGRSKESILNERGSGEAGTMVVGGEAGIENIRDTYLVENEGKNSRPENFDTVVNNQLKNLEQSGPIFYIDTFNQFIKMSQGGGKDVINKYYPGWKPEDFSMLVQILKDKGGM